MDAIKDTVLKLAHGELSCDLSVEQNPSSAVARTADTDGTNLRLWPTAVVMARYLFAHPDLVRGKRVVELGAGSGIIGLVCAALGYVVPSPRPPPLPLARQDPEEKTRCVLILLQCVERGDNGYARCAAAD